MLAPAMARRHVDKLTDRRLVAFVEDLMAVLDIPEVRDAVREALANDPPPPTPPRSVSAASGRGRPAGGRGGARG